MSSVARSRWALTWHGVGVAGVLAWSAALALRPLVHDDVFFHLRTGELVARTGVGLAPGTAFGPEGEGYLRFCFASSEQRLSEALSRMEPMLK